MTGGLSDFTQRIFHRLTAGEKFVDGNHVLIIYYVVVIVFFLIDSYLRAHMHKLVTEAPEDVSDKMMRAYKLYEKHGFILVNLLLYVICVGLTIHTEGWDLEYLFTITLSFIVFTILMKLFLRIFINEESYENGMFLRYLNVICYMILGNFFGLFMPFVKEPNLIIVFAGLLTGLVICFYIMIQAIFNPQILMRQTERNMMYGKAYGILKGMLGVVVCILALEYLMVYACYLKSPDFYSVSEGRMINGWDMFYYLIITFTTIGYGDIYPQRFDGMFYSEFTAIIIGLSSMFTTACFVAAVISTANNIAQNANKKTEKQLKKKRVLRKPKG